MVSEEKWDEQRLIQFIQDEIEEHSYLEYKRAESLDRTDRKKFEITKDISAMANSAGGIIIFGIAEYDEDERRHLPEQLSPIDRLSYSKEWLDQIISSIQPPIKGLLIHSVDLSSNPNDVAYIVEIPQSNTAHQARDLKYYRRRNTTIEPMEHYKIIDVVNRGIKPDVDVKFNYFIKIPYTGELHVYDLQIRIINSPKLINYFQLDFSFEFPSKFSYKNKEIDKIIGKAYLKRIIINSDNVLFPNQILDLSLEHPLRYHVDNNTYYQLEDKTPIITWTLYADDMKPKEGKVLFEE